MHDKYSITLSDGTRWTYAPRGEDEALPWLQVVRPGNLQPRVRALACRTPADFRACADVVERWERDHAPKMRRRVVEIGNRYWARHTILPGWVYATSATGARTATEEQDHVDHFVFVEATDANIDALLSLRDQPDEEYTDDE
jgi:hypothetical protein